MSVIRTARQQNIDPLELLASAQLSLKPTPGELIKLPPRVPDQPRGLSGDTRPAPLPETRYRIIYYDSKPTRRQLSSTPLPKRSSRSPARSIRTVRGEAPTPAATAATTPRQHHHRRRTPRQLKRSTRRPVAADPGRGTLPPIRLPFAPVDQRAQGAT